MPFVNINRYWDLFSFSFHLEIGHTAPTQESSSCPDECDDVYEGGEQMEEFLSRALGPCPPVQDLLAPQAEEREKKKLWMKSQFN